MTVGFFQGEIQKAQDRFDAIYGGRHVCDLEVRNGLVIAISWMGVLKKRVIRTSGKGTSRADIQKFVRSRDIVNSIFNRIETELGERGCHGNAGNVAERSKDASTGVIGQS